jgi:hypothetical protein
MCCPGQSPHCPLEIFRLSYLEGSLTETLPIASEPMKPWPIPLWCESCLFQYEKSHQLFPTIMLDCS